MDKRDADLDRLLRAAAQSTDTPSDEAPFGFDTRVVANWRAQRSDRTAESWELARLLRRLTTGAVLLMACASAGALWQFEQSDDLDEPATNAYAIADSVIEAGTWQ